MGTSPTFVSYGDTAFNSTTTPKTVPITTQTGDLIIVMGFVENGGLPTTTAPTGNSLTYAQQDAAPTVDNDTVGRVITWTAIETGAGANFNVSITRPTSDPGIHWGGAVWVWRNHGGIGATTIPTAGSTSSSITDTLAANSAWCIGQVDWNAVDGTTRTRRTVNSSTGTERRYYRDSARYMLTTQDYADVGSAGSKTGGYSAPTGQKSTIAGVEVLGTAGTTEVIKTVAASWNVVGQIIKTVAATWNVKATVTKTVAASWNVKQDITKTIAASWNVIQQVIKTVPASWNVKQQVIKTVPASWNVRTETIKTVPASWDVLTEVIKTVPASWNVASALVEVIKTVSATWNVKAVVTKTVSATWNLKETVIKTVPATWNVASDSEVNYFWEQDDLVALGLRDKGSWDDMRSYFNNDWFAYQLWFMSNADLEVKIRNDDLGQSGTITDMRSLDD